MEEGMTTMRSEADTFGKECKDLATTITNSKRDMEG